MSIQLFFIFNQHFFSVHERTSKQLTKNRWQKFHFKNKEKNKKQRKTIMNRDVPVLQWRAAKVKRRHSFTKVPKLTPPPTPTQQRYIFSLKSSKHFHNEYNNPQKRRERVQKRGIKLPLYKNRFFPQESFCLFFLIYRTFCCQSNN